MSFFAQRRAAWPVLGCLAAVATPLCAQDVVQGASGMQQFSTAEQLRQTAYSQPTTYVQARLSLGETYFSRSGSASGSQSDAITRVTPGLYLSSRAGRVRGFLDYAVTGVAYARGSESNRLLQELRSKGTAELVERRVFLDAQALVSQQFIDPLGVDAADDQVSRANRSEVRTLVLTPRTVGRLGDLAQWEASVSHRATHSAAVTTSDSSSTQWQLQLGNAAQQRAALGWGAQLSHTVQGFNQGRSTVNDLARATLEWRADAELSAGVNAGYEVADIITEDKEGRATYGARLRWTPSERTSLVAEVDRRFFGNAHNVVLAHRMARSVLSISDTRGVSYGQGQPLNVGRGSVYEFFDQLYASTETDLSAREAKVLQTLSKYGYSATQSSAALPAFLSSALTLQRAQQVSYSWVGVRDTITLSLQQTSGRRVETRQVFDDPFTANATIRQRGFSMLLTHRLTPLSRVTLDFTQRRNIGDTDSTRLRSTTAQFSTSLGPRTSFSLSARHADFKSSTQPYTESALTGSVSMTF